jgi:hypothetical protein
MEQLRGFLEDKFSQGPSKFFTENSNFHDQDFEPFDQYLIEEEFECLLSREFIDFHEEVINNSINVLITFIEGKIRKVVPNFHRRIFGIFHTTECCHSADQNVSR